MPSRRSGVRVGQCSDLEISTRLSRTRRAALLLLEIALTIARKLSARALGSTLKQPWSLFLTATVALCVGVVVASSTASAQAVFAGDGAFASPVGASFASPGGGFAFRLGRRLSVPSFWQTPELAVSYAVFAASQSNLDPDGFRAIRGVIGSRLTSKGVLRAGLFAHIGLGRVMGQIGTREANLLVTESISHTAFTWDGGLTLDLVLAPSFELGAHAGYNQIMGLAHDRTFRWFEVGGHLAIVL
jgi:hypothetical protein